VEVRYRCGEKIFEEEAIEEVILTSECLEVIKEEGEIKTCERGGRTSILAGRYSMEANLVSFKVTKEGVNEVSASGEVKVSGPEASLEAEKILISTVDQVLHAIGNVSFNVLGQEGEAEEVEVNFASGLAIKLKEGRVGGNPESFGGAK